MGDREKVRVDTVDPGLDLSRDDEHQRSSLQSSLLQDSPTLLRHANDTLHTRHLGHVERNGTGVEFQILDYENPGSNHVVRC